MTDRGRLTPVDVVIFVVVAAVLASLGPVFLDFLAQNAYLASTPVVYLAQLIVPVSVIVLLAVIYINAVQGVGRR